MFTATRFLALLMLAASAFAQTVTYHAFPDMTRRSMNLTSADYDREIKEVKEALDARLISESPFDIVALANTRHYQQSAGIGVPFSASDGRVKTWFYWSPLEVVMAARNADGSYVEEQWGESIEGMQWTTKELRDFYSAYNATSRPHFPTIPKFVRVKFTADEAGRLQFGDGPGTDFPIAKMSRPDTTGVTQASNYPADVAFCFRDEDGRRKLFWFKISEYKRAYPITVTANIPPQQQVPNGMLFFQLKAVVNNTALSPDEILSAVRRLFGLVQ